MGTEPPYRRIAAEIAAEIARGDLAPGDHVPSTRQIIARYDVAMATASKVLIELRGQGLVHTRPGVGTVVAAPAHRSPGPRPEGLDDVLLDALERDTHVRGRKGTRRSRGPAVAPGVTRVPEAESDTRERIVRAAVDVADVEGLRGLTMRRLAGELGVSAMSLYRHVRDKEELLLLMMDRACAGFPPPDPPPDGWRAQLEALARLQWAMYRRHPWLAEAMSFTRPLLAPHAMAHTEWAMRALDGHGLSRPELFLAAVTLANHVRGTAVGLEAETAAEEDSGMSEDEWMAAQQERLAAVLSGGDFPIMAATVTAPDAGFTLDELMESGLRWLLDGFARRLQG